MSNAPAKTPVIEGRQRLTDEKFSQENVNIGRGELWWSPNGDPAFIVYFGPEYGKYFLTESLNNALAQP